MSNGSENVVPPPIVIERVLGGHTYTITIHPRANDPGGIFASTSTSIDGVALHTDIFYAAVRLASTPTPSLSDMGHSPARVVVENRQCRNCRTPGCRGCGGSPGW